MRCGAIAPLLFGLTAMPLGPGAAQQESTPPSPVAQPATPSIQAPAGQPAAVQAGEAALAERGAKLFAKCQACHSLEPNGRNKVGPRLSGLFGRVSGSVPDYQYSEALKKARIRWTAATLDRFLAGTTEMVPGTKMYAGMARAEDRRALIVFLEQATRP